MIIIFVDNEKTLFWIVEGKRIIDEEEAEAEEEQVEEEEEDDSLQRLSGMVKSLTEPSHDSESKHDSTDTKKQCNKRNVNKIAW